MDNSRLMQWDLFCRVIDNYGDIGVCWRLAADLAARAQSVRLFVDDPSALAWMAPQGCPHVAVHGWAEAGRALAGDVVIEAFGCEPPADFVAAMASRARTQGHAPAWINLEYLTAEPFAERAHGLPSPVLSGPGAGLTKRFFYPGFTARTGGLLREQDLLSRWQAFDAQARQAWLQQHGAAHAGLPPDLRVSLFCYEPPALDDLLAQWAAGPQRTQLLVTAGRATQAVRARLAEHPAWQLPGGALDCVFLPALTQTGYDHLLWACDLNFVRGEDSVVRAIWAGRPFVWNIYPQDDGAHWAKLDAFMQVLGLPEAVRAYHRHWNGLQNQPTVLPPLDGWADAVLRARDRLLAQDDLTRQLLRFVAEMGKNGLE